MESAGCKPSAAQLRRLLVLRQNFVQEMTVCSSAAVPLAEEMVSVLTNTVDVDLHSHAWSDMLAHGSTDFLQCWEVEHIIPHRGTQEHCMHGQSRSEQQCALWQRA